jgi:hypothetical protein
VNVGGLNQRAVFCPHRGQGAALRGTAYRQRRTEIVTEVAFQYRFHAANNCAPPAPLIPCSHRPPGTVLNRLRQVGGLDALAPRQVRDGARQLEDTVEGPRAHL